MTVAITRDQFFEGIYNCSPLLRNDIENRWGSRKTVRH